MREWPLDSSSLKSFTHWIYFLVTVTELLSYSIRVVVSLDRASLIAQLVKNLPAMQERSAGEGIGYPLQYPCLEIPTDRGGWQATVHRVTKSQT